MNLKKIIEQKGIRVHELSALSGITLGAVYKILNGTTKVEKIQLGTAYAMAKYLKMPIEDIFYGDTNNR